MTTAAPSITDEEWERLRDWLREHGVAADQLSERTLLSGGTQNLMMRFTAADRTLVVRIVPAHDSFTAQKTVERELGLLRALAHSDLPLPTLIGGEADTTTMGHPFYVTEYVEGHNVAEEVPLSIRTDPLVRAHLAGEVGRVAAELAGLDVYALGLAGLSRTDGWHERQASRWLRLLESHGAAGDYYPTITPGCQLLSRWLGAHPPGPRIMGLLHGDFHMGNLLFSESGDLTAIVDWELASVGDPLLDLAHLLILWPGRLAALPVAAGWSDPGQEPILEAYQAAGCSTEGLPWFIVLASYRMAVLLEGTHGRARQGLADPAVGQRLHSIAVELVERAVELAT